LTEWHGIAVGFFSMIDRVQWRMRANAAGVLYFDTGAIGHGI
jgi:hypothetical protein